MRVAYFDCFSGASGDMILGALVDAGLSLEQLRAELEKLPATGYHIDVERGVRQGLSGSQARVVIESEEPESRGIAGHLAAVQNSALSPSIKEKGLRILRSLAEAEGSIHGVEPEAAELHELGSLDTLIDVVGAVAGLAVLGIEEVFCSALPLGSGWVETRQGRLPVPSPAALEILKRAGAPVLPGVGQGELVTPTGAAILASLASFAPPTMTVERVGYGFGQRELPWPNALRVLVGQAEGSLPRESVALLTTNIDDQPGEQLAHAMEVLFAAGALDVHFVPVQMKKSRPGVQLSVIAPLAQSEELAQVILRETSSLGLRIQRIERVKVERWYERVETELGPLTMKVWMVDDQLRASPEYEECAEMARQRGIPLVEVYNAAVVAARQRGWLCL
ncbi:MAG: nickel pincer cofactor biosynthesis protein LarC [Chloroflexi bacterium]|nr:nickel pincer cofactor biosynthesis protein LarC [Chloroflexota bacterium]